MLFESGPLLQSGSLLFRRQHMPCESDPLLARCRLPAASDRRRRREQVLAIFHRRTLMPEWRQLLPGLLR
jgi:hypothetical protein